MTLIMMRFFLLACIAVVGTEAFVPVLNHNAGRVVASTSSSLMALSEPPSNRQAAAGGFARFFGVVAAASVLSLNIVDPASAANSILENNGSRILAPFASTSVQIADAIKTLDFSLPSYSEIKDPKASTENTKSLYVDPSLVNKYGVVISQSKNSSPDAKVASAPVAAKSGDATKKSVAPLPKPPKVTYEF